MFTLGALREDGFSWQIALSLAFASKIAYQPKATIVSVVTDWGFSKVDFIEAGDTQCFVATADDVALIAFRGTESLGDWLGNLQLNSAPEGHGNVHSGFLSGYTRVRASIRDVVQAGDSSVRKFRLTGHSLGGALATLAASDLLDLNIRADVYTCGQPRVGDTEFQQFINAEFSNRFFRFVNDDDLVTRIPPGYRHVGLLKHFDADGTLREPTVTEESVTSNFEGREMSEAEFRRVQATINRQREVRSTAGLEAVGGNADAGLEGIIPGLTDHRIDQYIAAIGRHARPGALDVTVEIEEAYRPVPKSEWEARFPVRRSFGLEGLETASVPSEAERENLEIAFAKQSRQDVPLLIRLKDSNWKAPANLIVNSQFGTFVSAIASKNDLQQLRNDPGIASIEVSRDAGVQELATSVPFIQAQIVHRPPLDEKGDRALIGIIDSGIDVLHEAFRGKDGKSRILAVWNQRDSTGPAPRTVDAKFTQTTGTLYTAAKIEKFIAGTVPTPPALRDPNLHGTHVASIAGGHSVGPLADGVTPPDGVAPEARLVVVIPSMTTRPGDAPSLGYSLSHIDGLSFLKLVCQGSNAILAEPPLPMAVNVSLGMNAGAHDGTSGLEAAFDSITGSGRDPGFVIVKSAGNERGQAGHTRVQVAEGAVVDVKWNSKGRQPQDYIEAWYSPSDVLKFMLIDPKGNKSAEVSETSPVVKQTLGGNLCQLSLDPNHRDNGDKLLVIAISPEASPVQSGDWTLTVEGVRIRQSGHVDLWVERDDSRAVHFARDVEQMTLSIPGTANTVITVGACDTGSPLRITDSSSFGSTRDGRAKPDICAPGKNIQAACANTADHRAVIPMTGTSMAAPHVTGALALVLSRRHKTPAQPQYNARQLRSALMRTTKNFNGRHNEGVGFGMLDAVTLFTDLK